MNKQELITTVANRAQVTKKETEAVLNAFYETVIDAVAKGDTVKIQGFGNFEARKRSARTARNPKTGEEFEVPESISFGFKASGKVKEVLNS